MLCNIKYHSKENGTLRLGNGNSYIKTEEKKMFIEVGERRFLYSLISISCLFAITGCIIFKNNSKTNMEQNTALSYQISTDTIKNKIINRIIFSAPKKTSCVVISPYEINQDKEYWISDGVKTQGYSVFTITRSDVPLIQYRLFIPDDAIQHSVLESEHLGATPRKCFSVIKNDTINFVENEYADSCFQIQRLEPPLDTFVIEYSERENSANKLTIKKANALFEKGMDV